jgi:hypothetical protein
MNRPWEEHELSYAQRRAIRRAHGRIRLYDVGWKKNLVQVFGRSPSVADFLSVLLYGGKPKGDGKRFEFNHRARPMLVELADELVKIQDERGEAAPTVMPRTMLTTLIKWTVMVIVCYIIYS